MPQVFLSSLARSDLDEIWDYIAQDSVRAADGVVDALVHAMGELATLPQSGRLRPELDAHIRSMPCGSYVIFYRPMDTGVAISRILHGARDLGDQPYPPVEG